MNVEKDVVVYNKDESALELKISDDNGQPSIFIGLDMNDKKDLFLQHFERIGREFILQLTQGRLLDPMPDDDFYYAAEYSSEGGIDSTRIRVFSCDFARTDLFQAIGYIEVLKGKEYLLNEVILEDLA